MDMGLFSASSEWISLQMDVNIAASLKWVRIYVAVFCMIMYKSGENELQSV